MDDLDYTADQYLIYTIAVTLWNWNVDTHSGHAPDMHHRCNTVEWKLDLAFRHGFRSDAGTIEIDVLNNVLTTPIRLRLLPGATVTVAQRRLTHYAQPVDHDTTMDWITVTSTFL